MKTLVYTVALSVLPLWWIVVVLWQPAFIGFLSTIAYRFEPPTVSLETVAEARRRALQYSTVGVGDQTDVVFTTDELSHLSDVHRLYVPFSRIIDFAGTCAWIVLLAAVVRKEKLTPMFAIVWKVYAAVFVLALLSLVTFGASFILFHEVLFPQGNWSFPADSLLIQTFPEIFWKLMLGFTLLCFGLVAVLYRVIATALQQSLSS